MRTKRASLHAAAARGAVVLGVCGGYQLLGHAYTIGDEEIEGVGLLDVRTVRDPGPRLIGNVAIEVSLEDPENPGAKRGAGAGLRTTAGAPISARTPDPLGRVVKGHGNDGRSGYEGARQGATIGTYLHGPLLPKNAWFADWLIATALDSHPHELTPLEDTWSARPTSAPAAPRGFDAGPQSTDSLSRRYPNRAEIRSAVEIRCGPRASASSSTAIPGALAVMSIAAAISLASLSTGRGDRDPAARELLVLDGEAFLEDLGELVAQHGSWSRSCSGP